MKIAIVGDVHGKIKNMYDQITEIENTNRIRIDQVLQLGDFHAIRDEKDLNQFSAPAKYRVSGDFPDYCEKGFVPKSTFFIGGNHENYSWLSEFEAGTEILKDLFYSGRAGVKDFQGVKVGWVSGNYSEKSYNGKRKKYGHLSSDDVQKVINQDSIDILLFHDWPSIADLSPHILQESVSNQETLKHAIRRNLGSPPLYELMKKIRPKIVFCGHVHAFLDLEAKIEDTNVRLISLSQLGHSNSICVLDTNNWTIDYKKSKEQSIFDVIPHSEREFIKIAFSDLEADHLDHALKKFREILSGDYSQEAKAFSNYGIGLVRIKQTRTRGFTHLPDIEDSIRHLYQSLQSFEHADAHLMLGYALKNKILHLFTNEAASMQKDTNLIDTINKAINEFRKANSLNKSYLPNNAQEISDLERLKRGLQKRILSRN